MNLFPQVAKNTLAQILGRAGVILATIFTTAILTRFLGTSGYGNYVFITSFILLFTAISDWGTSIISVREAAKNKKKEEKFFSNALVFRFALALICFVVINALTRVLSQFQTLILATTIASFLLLLHSIRTSCHIIFQTRLKFEYLALTEFLISGLFLGLLILGLRGSLNLVSIMLFLVSANLFGTVLAFFLSRTLAGFDFAFSKAIFKKILFEAMPTGALLLIFSIYNRVDILILQAIKGSESVGIYGLAYRVHDNLILGAAFLAGALFPLLSKFAAEQKFTGNLQLIYRKSFDVLFLGGLTVLISILIFAPWIIGVIGGPAFTQSTLALRILVFATFLAYFNHLTGYTLIALGKQKISLLVAIIALIWNVSLNFILIPRYSFIAAAGVTIATEGLVLILTSFYLAKYFSLYPSLAFPKTLIEIIKTRGKIF